MRVISIFTVAVAVVLAVAMILVSAFRESPLSPVELALWEGFSLLLGLFGSFMFGRYAAREVSYDLIRPHARSALRSVLVLRRGLARLYDAIARLHAQNSDPHLEALLEQVQNQSDTADSIVADWRDVIPDDFEEVVATLEQLDGRREAWRHGDRD